MNRRELKLALSSAQRIVVMALEEADDSLAKEDLPPTSEELETVRSAIREASRAVAELERRVPGAEMSIDDFFREIGDGMVAAQQSLDRRSREYLEAGPEHAIPSVYRIPKVQAELSFALESTAKSGFNVLLFGSSKQEQERQQQKISFEIVAAPPPPEVAAQVAGASIGTVVVTNVYQRERLRAGLAAYAAEHPADHLVALTRAIGRKAELFVQHFERVLVLPGATAALLLVLPTPEDDAKLQLHVLYAKREAEAWFPTDPATKANTIPAPLTATARAQPFLRVLDELAGRQATALARGQETGD